MSEGTSPQKDDSFPDIFRKQSAVMLLIEPKTGRILDANPAAIKFYGYSLEQFKGMYFVEISPLYGSQLTGKERRVTDGGEDSFISPHTLAGGEVRMVELHSSPVVVNGDTVLFTIMQDVTGRGVVGSDERFRAFAENTPSVIYQCRNDDRFTFLYVNHAIMELTGYPPEFFLNGSITFADLCHPEDVALVSRPSSGAFHITYRIRHASGEWRWLDELGTGIVGENTGGGYFQGVMVDVTERMFVESELVRLFEAEQRTNQVTEILRAANLALTRELNLDTVLEKLLEYLRQLVPYDSANVMLVRDHDRLIISAMRGYEDFTDAASTQALEFDFRHSTAFVRIMNEQRTFLIADTRQFEGWTRDPGTEHVISWMGVPLIAGGRVIGLYSVDKTEPNFFTEQHQNFAEALAGQAAIAIQNARLFAQIQAELAERKFTENALRESEERYRSLFENMIDGIYRSTPEGKFVEINPAMVRMFGYSSRQEMMNIDIKNELYFSPDERGSHILDTGQPEIEAYRMRRKDGSEIWVEDHGNYIHDENGGIKYHGGMLRDITERKRSEDILHQRLLELESLYNALSSLRTVQTFSESLSILMDQMLAAIGSDTGAILLYHASSGELRNASARGWFEKIRDISVKVGEGVAGTVFVTGQPYLTDEFVKDSLPKKTARSKIPSQWGGACIPIRAAADTVGVLFVAVKLPRQITQEQMKLLASLAEIAGAILHRTRLFDETARRAQEFASLYETSNALSAETELEIMLQVIVNNAKKLLNGASSGMYLYLPASNELELTKMDTDSYLKVGTRLQMGEGVAGVVAQTRKPLRINDYSTWEGRSQKYKVHIIRAVLEVPMLYGGELIGVLTVDEIGDSNRKFTESDERLLSLFASQAAGALHSARLRDEALQRLQHLQTLRTIDKAITSSLDLGITLNILLTHVNTQLEVDASSILLLQKHEQSLKFSAGKGFRTRLIEGAEVHLNDDFAGRSVMDRRIIQISDPAQISANSLFAYFWAEEGFKSYVCVPLISKGEVKGVMEVYRRSKFTPGDEWIEFLETLAGQAAITVDNAQMFDKVQRVNMELAIAYEATIEGWSRALDLRDKETEGHTQRVTELTMLLAKAVGIKDSELQHIRRGALLHDIGKMGISDSILLKEGKLTKKEWEIMSTHPKLAHQMLQPIAYLRNALDIPFSHHEKWDGTGYPRGLKGEQIPLTARLFALADVWDALTSARPYRKAWTKKKALTYIKEQSGKHFDPQLVEIFLRTIKELDG